MPRVDAQGVGRAVVAWEHWRRQRRGMPTCCMRGVAHAQDCRSQHILQIADHQVRQVPAHAVSVRP